MKDLKRFLKFILKFKSFLIFALADKIILMENGKILDQGTHEELLEKSLIYKNLFKTQFIETKI